MHRETRGAPSLPPRGAEPGSATPLALSGRDGLRARLTSSPAHWSLATRVAVAASVLLALLLVIVIETQREAHQGRRQAEVENAVDVGMMVAGTIEAFVKDLETTTLVVSALIGAQPVIEQAGAGPILSQTKGAYPILRAIFVTDRDGRVIATDSGEGIGVDLSERPYMQALIGGDDTVWGRVTGSESGEVVATFGRVIGEVDGGPRGFLVAAVYPRRLPQLLEGRLPADADVTVVSQDRVVMHSTDYPDLGFEARDVSVSPAINEAMGGRPVVVDGGLGLLDDRRRFGVVVPLLETGWVIAYTRPLEPLESSLQRQLLVQGGGVSSAVILVGATLIWTAHRITRPLSELALAARAVARGERPDVPDVRGGGEVGELASAMRFMSAAVAEREDAMRRESQWRRILADATRAFSEAGVNLDGELQTVARRVAEDVGDGCVVYMLPRDTGRLDMVALNHRRPDALAVAREMLEVEPMGVGEGMAGRAVQSGSTVVVADDPDEIRGAYGPVHRPYIERLGMRSALAIPLRARGRIIGVLKVWRSEVDAAYEPDETRTLEAIAAAAGLTIDNARLLEEAREHADTIERSTRAHDEFIAMVAHDLRSPLASIDATAKLIQRRVARADGALDVERLVDDMKRIEATVATTAKEIDASLDVAQWQLGQSVSLDYERLDMNELIRQAVEEHQRLTRRHEIRLDAAASELFGEWDARRLARVFGNLLSNAMKYSPDGGEIAVSAQQEGSGEDETVVVTVSDHGIGIPPAALDRIYERFYRADNVSRHYSGTGLGLTAVRYIVDAHGGTIDVRSTVGQGTTFAVSLPVQPRKPIPPPRGAGVASGASSPDAREPSDRG